MKDQSPQRWRPSLLFRGMPPVLIGLFFGFLTVPIFSLSLNGCPFLAPQSAGSVSTAVWALAFWVVPIAIAYALVLKHHWFLPLYLVQCALFVALALFVEGSFPEARRASQGLLVVSMLYLGLLFGNKNLLYPFLMKSPRLWRRAPRYEIGRPVLLQGENSSWQIQGLLVDGSHSGLAVTLPLIDFRSVLREVTRGSRFSVTVKADPKTELREYQLPVELVWKAETKQNEGKLGCRTLNGAPMKEYLKAERTKRAAQIPFHELSDDFALEQDIQQIALLLWMVCIAITLSLPRSW